MQQQLPSTDEAYQKHRRRSLTGSGRNAFHALRPWRALMELWRISLGVEATRMAPSVCDSAVRIKHFIYSWVVHATSTSATLLFSDALRPRAK